MPADQAIAPSAVEARRRFLDACAEAGASVLSVAHPLPGQGRQAHHADIAWLGPPDARQVAMVIAGLRGTEASFGGACLTAWLRRQTSARSGRSAAVVLVHAAEPFGAARQCRTDQDNIDQKRNFLDFDAPVPENPGYAVLADTFAPEHWSDAEQALAARIWRSFMDSAGEEAFVRAATLGQGTDPRGIYYAGAGPSWTHRLLRGFAADRLGGCRTLAVLDLGTGYGASGRCSLQCRQTLPADRLGRLERIFGTVLAPDWQGARLLPVPGDVGAGLARWLDAAAVFAVSLKIGTYPEDRVFRAVRADNWLRRDREPDSAKTRALREDVAEAFCPASADWRRHAVQDAVQVIDHTVRHLDSAAA